MPRITNAQLAEMITRLDMKIDNVAAGVRALNERMGAVEQRLDSVEQRLGAVEDRLQPTKRNRPLMGGVIGRGTA